MTYFNEFAEKTLKEHLGVSGEDLYSKVTIRIPLDEHSSSEEMSDFIHTVEHLAATISTQEKAAEIGHILKMKLYDAIEDKKQEAIEKIDMKGMESDIDEFVHQNSLPTDTDINDFAKYLALKCGTDANEIRKEITAKIKTHIKEAITRDKIQGEINKFLSSYPQPSQKDVNDFVQYLKLQKLTFEETKLREEVESIRLYRKFKAPEEKEELNEMDQFIDTIKSNNSQESLSKAMEEQELSYLIKDEDGSLTDTISEFMDLAAPDEDDMKGMLKGLGLDHMIKK